MALSQKLYVIINSYLSEVSLNFIMRIIILFGCSTKLILCYNKQHCIVYNIMYNVYIEFLICNNYCYLV